MKGFTHIYNELTSQGFEPKKIGEFERTNPHGRRFYSDGRYLETVYEVDKNSDYQIGVKTTGRVEIKLYEKGSKKPIKSANSQKKFIDLLEEKGILTPKEDEIS